MRYQEHNELMDKKLEQYYKDTRDPRLQTVINAVCITGFLIMLCLI